MGETIYSKTWHTTQTKWKHYNGKYKNKLLQTKNIYKEILFYFYFSTLEWLLYFAQFRFLQGLCMSFLNSVILLCNLFEPSLIQTKFLFANSLQRCSFACFSSVRFGQLCKKTHSYQKLGSPRNSKHFRSKMLKMAPLKC